MDKNLYKLPYNDIAELNVLSCIVGDVDNQYEFASRFKPDDFYLEKNKIIFDSIQSILALNKPVNVVTLQDDLSKTFIKQKGKKVDLQSLSKVLSEKSMFDKVGGIDYLTEIVSTYISSINFEHYCDIVKRDSVNRRLIESCVQIIDKASKSENLDSSVTFAEEKIYKISDDMDRTTLENLNSETDSVLNLFEMIQKNKNFNQGLNTGFKDLDKLTFGLHRGNLIILAARPSVGKTTLAMNIITNCALRENSVCAFFSLEMTKEELEQRVLCSIAGVSNQVAKNGKLTDDDWKKLFNAKVEQSNTKIYVDDTSLATVSSILSKCRRLKTKENRLDLVVVDHLQLMNVDKKSSGENRQAEITEISRGLKMIAKELNVPVLVLSQLSRSSAKENRKPVLSDLRESGSIEQDADIVFFIHREEEKAKEGEEEGVKKSNVNVEILVRKNRHGPLGEFRLLLEGEKNRFVKVSDDNIAIPGNLTGSEKGGDLANIDYSKSNMDESKPSDSEVPLEESF